MKQAEKSKETKRRVQDAAEALFAVKGFEQTTMQDIIEKSGMSRGAIYHQYESKQEILQALTIRAQEEIRAYFEFVLNNQALTAKEKIVNITGSFGKSSLQNNLINAGWVEKVPFSLLDTLRYSIKEFAPLLTNIIQQGIEQKEFSCNDPFLTAEFILIIADIWLDPVIFHWTKEEACARLDYLFNILTKIAPGMIDIDNIEMMKQSLPLERRVTKYENIND